MNTPLAMQATETNSQLPEDRPSGPQRSKPRLQDPSQYANAIDAYSKLTAAQSLYAGTHYKNLATYLQQPFEACAPNVVTRKSGSQVKQNYKFITLYDLDPNALTRVRHIDSINEFESEASNLLTNSAFGHLLFMRGHPSPEWLLAIGTRYQVDPEFFQRHLDFRQGQPDHFALPSLPSTSTSMIKLRITTIGDSRVKAGTDHSQEALESLRAQQAELMANYRKRLKSHSELKLGDSIVRDCSIHDMQHFAIEQDISVYVTRGEKSWAGLVWLDNGSDLSDGFTSLLTSPLRTHALQTNYLPIIQHKPGIALRPRSRLLKCSTGLEVCPGKIPQSASLIHLDYGRNLDRNIAASNAFYAFHELFCLAAFSEVQFLNMLESKLQKELDQSVLIRQKNPTLSNLLYNQQVLDRHIQRIKDNIVSIQHHSSSTAPQSLLAKEKPRKADDAAEKLRQDYEYLLARALILSEQCNRGMQVVMNNAMIKESREAISQAKGVVKLTRLAFIFIPLSFTTSFCGMNFSQFGTGRLSIWVCCTTEVFVQDTDAFNALTSVKFFNLNLQASMSVSCIMRFLPSQGILFIIFPSEYLEMLEGSEIFCLPSLLLVVQFLSA